MAYSLVFHLGSRAGLTKVYGSRPDFGSGITCPPLRETLYTRLSEPKSQMFIRGTDPLPVWQPDYNRRQAVEDNEVA
jgi:hypothetical protein